MSNMDNTTAESPTETCPHIEMTPELRQLMDDFSSSLGRPPSLHISSRGTQIPLFTGIDTELAKQHDRVRSNAIDNFNERAAALKTKLQALGHSEDIATSIITNQMILYFVNYQPFWNSLFMSPGVAQLAESLWFSGRLEEAMAIADLSAALAIRGPTSEEDISDALSDLNEAGVLNNFLQEDAEYNDGPSMPVMSILLTSPFEKFKECQSPTSSIPGTYGYTQICPKCTNRSDSRPHFSELRRRLHDDFEQRKTELASAERGNGMEAQQARIDMDCEYSTKICALWEVLQRNEDFEALHEEIEQDELTKISCKEDPSAFRKISSIFMGGRRQDRSIWPLSVTLQDTPIIKIRSAGSRTLDQLQQNRDGSIEGESGDAA